jgi:hypothetical protein
MGVEPLFFLEDVGELVASRGGRNIWLVRDLSRWAPFGGLELPERIYVVDFPGRGVGQEFLLGRQICGPRKFLMIREIGHSMVRLFVDRFVGRVAQFVILWGGRPLDLLDADPPIFADGLIDTTYIKLTRVEDPSSPRGWRVVRSSVAGQIWRDETWLVMEECIASGETVAYFAEEMLSVHRPERIFLFPVCASAEGLAVMYQTCRRHGVELIPVLNEAIVQVAEVGLHKPYTDLGLLPRTIVTREFFDALARRYQGKPLCWLGDVGDSLYKPLDHLLETLRDMTLLGWDFRAEDFDEWPEVIRGAEFREALAGRFPEVARKLGGELPGLGKDDVSGERGGRSEECR